MMSRYIYFCSLLSFPSFIIHPFVAYRSSRLIPYIWRSYLSTMSNLTGVEAAKRKAAIAAVDEFVTDGQVLGVGSGSTITYAIERLAERVQNEGLKITCVPTSFQSEQGIVNHGLELSDLARHPCIDIVIDGADEVDGNLNLIKGGGGCQLREKVVASCAKRMIVIADYRKNSDTLGEQWKKGVPIEVVPFAYVPLQRRIEGLGSKAPLRMASNKAGPVVTDNGNFILDADFGLISDPASLDTKLRAMPGVVETGFFINLAEVAFFGNDDGSVDRRSLTGNQ